jgi:hypothetical protein
LEDIFPTDSELDAIFSRRPGHPTHHESPALESIDLHEVVEFITPLELLNILSGCVYKTPKIIKENKQTAMLIPCDFGGIQIFSDQPGIAWNEESPTTDLIMVADFSGVYLSYERLNELNQRYEKFQLINVDDSLQARSHHTLKGGRTVQNILWTLIHHFQDAERVYKDVAVFSDDAMVNN